MAKTSYSLFLYIVTQTHTDLFGVQSGALFSDCGRYRYQLWRIWDEARPVALCVGLNPSTADGVKDDATMGIMKRVMKKLDYGGFYMVNLYGFISPHPKELLKCKDPIGENDQMVEALAQNCADIIFCWGNGALEQERADIFITRYPQALCFGYTLAGNPLHPRALSYQKKLNDPELYVYQRA